MLAIVPINFANVDKILRSQKTSSCPLKTKIQLCQVFSSALANAIALVYENNDDSATLVAAFVLKLKISSFK